MQYPAKLLVALCLTLGSTYPLMRALALPSPSLVAQTPTFSLPTTVPADTTLTIQSSPNLGIATQTLKEQFETAYDGTEVGVEVTSSDQALEALVAGDIDLAAIGRPLTEAEQALGLVTVPLERQKIAIIVGPDNPFAGGLTFAQFAAMFRGEITDWAQVGGAPGPIRFVDRPELSDTRRSLSQYEVFRNAPFATGATADPVAEDDTAMVIQALGQDGISYAIAPQVLGRDDIKIVPMHQTLPDDPRYPYSQPRYFVYRGAPTAAVAAFLGYATAAQGSAALAAAQQAEISGTAEALAPAPVAETPPGAIAPAPDTTPVPGETVPDDVTATPAPAVTPDPVAVAPVDAEGGAGWLWWLLPLAGLGALAWALSRRKGTAPVTPVAPEPVTPAAAVPAEPIAQPVATKPEITSSPGVDEVTTKPEIVSPLVASEITTEPEITSPPEVNEIVTEPEIIPPLVAEDAVEVVPVAPPAVPEPPVIPVSKPMPVVPEVAAGAIGIAGLAAGAAVSLASTEDQSTIEASKFNVVGRPIDRDIDLSKIDDGLPPLPDGYGDSRIVLMPRDPQWAYAYWDTPSIHKEELRQQGGERLALRLYDVTDIDLAHQAPHNMQQFNCDELAREWYLQIPVSDRDYQVEIGYLTGDGHWLVLAQSNSIRVPPVYPSDWGDDHFMTVAWQENLQGKTLMTLTDPRYEAIKEGILHEQMYALSQGTELERMAGSLYGSMPHVAGSMAPSQTVSSYLLASGAGLLTGPRMPGSNVSGLNVSGPNVSGLNVSGLNVSGLNVSGLNVSGLNVSGLSMAELFSISGPNVSGLNMSGLNMSGLNMSGLNMSGLNMSGLNVSGLTMSGVGFSASMPPIRPRQFWLVADAELIVYGATEPDATVTIGGQPIQLSPEGTFRFQTSFQDSEIDYPIMGVAADGEQNRSIHMKFQRRTPNRHTNTREEAQEEWPEE